MKIKKEESKIKPQMKISEEFLDLRTLKKNIILERLEENIRLRELPIEKHAKKNLLKE